MRKIISMQLCRFMAWSRMIKRICNKAKFKQEIQKVSDRKVHFPARFGDWFKDEKYSNDFWIWISYLVVKYLFFIPAWTEKWFEWRFGGRTNADSIIIIIRLRITVIFKLIEQVFYVCWINCALWKILKEKTLLINKID